MKHASRLVAAIIICELVGVLGAFFIGPTVTTWYDYLQKSTLTPPDSAFGPIWIILYIFMALAGYLVWNEGLKKKEVRQALVFFADQLALNLLWTVIFFGLQRPVAAFVEIIALWIVVLLTIISFAKVSKAAAWLLIPYIAWITFAGYLNYVICILN